MLAFFGLYALFKVEYRMKRLPQDLAVLIWLKENGTINPLEALKEIGCFRLSARIHNLKKKGYQITSKRITQKGRFGNVCFAEYRLKVEVE